MEPAPFTEAVTFLSTRDLQATDRFYRELLGLPLVVDQGDCRIYRITRESFVGFCQRMDAPEKPQGVVFTFVTADVDGWVARLQAQGVLFEKDPALNEKYQIYNCFFRDPNGYLLEIQRFVDPDWYHL